MSEGVHRDTGKFSFSPVAPSVRPPLSSDAKQSDAPLNASPRCGQCLRRAGGPSSSGWVRVQNERGGCTGGLVEQRGHRGRASGE
eukprot:4352657-Pyramimonas_sp.AAC.3